MVTGQSGVSGGQPFRGQGALEAKPAGPRTAKNPKGAPNGQLVARRLWPEARCVQVATWQTAPSATFGPSRAGPIVSFGAGARLSPSSVPHSSMPSARLEQEAQTFGLRDRGFPCSGIGSPQHRQIREFMGTCQAGPVWLAEKSDGMKERLETGETGHSTHTPEDIAT